MLPKLLLSLCLALSTTLFVQQPGNPTATAPAAPAPALEPPTPQTPSAPSPLSQATLDKIGKMIPLFDGNTLDGWESNSNAWMVKDGAMASTGAGRGVIYTRRDYGNFRLIFDMRHVSGQPDHQACILIFCTRPPNDQKGLDARGGIQFQPPNGGHWDYRPGHNNGGGTEFTKLPHPKFDPQEWSQVELLVHAQR